MMDKRTNIVLPNYGPKNLVLKNRLFEVKNAR